MTAWCRMTRTLWDTLNGFTSALRTRDPTSLSSSTSSITTSQTQCLTMEWRFLCIRRERLNLAKWVGIGPALISATSKTKLEKISTLLGIITHWPSHMSSSTIMTLSFLPTAFLTLTQTCRMIWWKSNGTIAALLYYSEALWQKRSVVSTAKSFQSLSQ